MIRSDNRSLLAVLLVLLLASTTTGSTPGHSPWVLIDTQRSTVAVMDGERPLMTFNDIAIGRYGTSADKRRGDNTTPLGRFRVTAVRRDSAFHRFIALDYPDRPRVERAWRDGLLDADERHRILAGKRAGSTPQDTALGGHIGIHGLGRADPALHRALNWTRGCVALTDRQVDALLNWVRVDTVVEIR